MSVYFKVIGLIPKALGSLLSQKRRWTLYLFCHPVWCSIAARSVPRCWQKLCSYEYNSCEKKQHHTTHTKNKQAFTSTPSSRERRWSHAICTLKVKLPSLQASMMFQVSCHVCHPVVCLITPAGLTSMHMHVADILLLVALQCKTKTNKNRTMKKALGRCMHTHFLDISPFSRAYIACISFYLSWRSIFVIS